MQLIKQNIKMKMYNNINENMIKIRNMPKQVNPFDMICKTLLCLKYTAIVIHLLKISINLSPYSAFLDKLVTILDIPVIY